MNEDAVDGLPLRPSHLDVEGSLRSPLLQGFLTVRFVRGFKSCKIRRLWHQINNVEVVVVENVARTNNLN